MNNYKVHPKNKNEVKIDGMTLTRTPAEMAHSMMEQGISLLDINFDHLAEHIHDMSAADILGVATMMRRSAELLEAAAVLKTVTGMPTNCPNCGVDLTQYIKDNEVW